VTERDDLLSHVPTGPVPSSQDGDRLLDLVRVMARLRAPDGCPWDREQTHASLARHLLEETHEVLDAIDADDRERLREELGDVLLQVAFHAQLAADEGAWDVDDVAQGIVEKLIRRHPHVFGDVEVAGADEVLVNWERIKAQEKGEKPLEDDIPPTLPALARASKVQRRAAGWGFEWRSPGSAIEALKEEVGELETHSDADNAEEEIGDVLFATVAVARKLGVDPETALRRTIRGLRRTLRAVQRAARGTRPGARRPARGRDPRAVPQRAFVTLSACRRRGPTRRDAARAARVGTLPRGSARRCDRGHG
jgi:tetrapyrrole methylase family protein/MazG family protein